MSVLIRPIITEKNDRRQRTFQSLWFSMLTPKAKQIGDQRSGRKQLTVFSVEKVRTMKLWSKTEEARYTKTGIPTWKKQTL